MGNVADLNAFALARQRYGRDELQSIPFFNSTLATLFNHRSVRAYLPAPLPDGTLELLIAAAQSAASSSNLQVWSVVAVQDPQRKARLAELAGQQQHIVEAPLLLVFVADHARLRTLAEVQQQPIEGLDYLDSFLMAGIDAALAAQNALVAAESHGLGTVYIGALRNQPQAVAEVLALPPGVFPLFGLVIGQPDLDRPAAVKPRLPQRAVLHLETYDATVQLDAIAEYDQHIKQFYQSQQLPTSSWSEHALSRLHGPAQLYGRDQLKPALLAHAFPLK